MFSKKQFKQRDVTGEKAESIAAFDKPISAEAERSKEKILELQIAKKEGTQIGLSKPIEFAFPTTPTTTLHETQPISTHQHEQQEFALKIEVILFLQHKQISKLLIDIQTSHSLNQNIAFIIHRSRIFITSNLFIFQSGNIILHLS